MCGSKKRGVVEVLGWPGRATGRTVVSGLYPPATPADGGS